MSVPFEMTAFIIDGCPVKARELATELVGENRPYLVFSTTTDLARLDEYVLGRLWPLVIISEVGIESVEYDLKKMITREGYSVYSVSVR